jgi:NAD+ diphosphatase
MTGESIYKHYQPAVSPGSENGSSAYWFVFQSNQLLVKNNHGKVDLPLAACPGEMNLTPIRTQYLGLLYERPCYSAEVSSETRTPDGMSFHELRPLYGVLDEDLFWLAGKANQIVNWDRTHQYCGRCGHKTEDLREERAKKCPACGLISYANPCPAVITAVFRDSKILLSHNIAFPGKRYSLIAGFVEPGETLEECASREILEEVGIRVKNLRYFGSQAWPFPNSLMIGFTAEYAGGDLKADGKEISDTNWFEADNLPDLPPRMSIAREIIDWFIRNKPDRQ